MVLGFDLQQLVVFLSVSSHAQQRSALVVAASRLSQLAGLERNPRAGCTTGGQSVVIPTLLLLAGLHKP